MIDRNNADDIYNVINDDFNWIIEDMTQHNSIVKESLMQCYEEDRFDDGEEFKQKYKDIKKLIEKLENIRQEYSSICKDDVEKKEENNVPRVYEELADWTDADLESIELFGKEYKMKYWRDMLVQLLEELYKKNKNFINGIDKIEDFKGRTRIYFTFDEELADKRYYKKLSFGLYVMVNSNANSIVSLCKKVLRIAGFKDNDLKIKVEQNNKTDAVEDIKIELDKEVSMIKLPRKYASISIDTDLFKTIVYSFLNRKDEFGTDYIEPRKVQEKFDSIITSRTKYTISYHVVINIIKYLKDFRFIDNYSGTKKGKYVIKDDTSLKTWVENNI